MRLAKEERLRRLGFHIEDLSKVDEYHMEEDEATRALRIKVVRVLKAHGATAQMLRACVWVWFHGLGYREAGRKMGVHSQVVIRMVTAARDILEGFKRPICGTVSATATVGVWLQMPVDACDTLTASL